MRSLAFFLPCIMLGLISCSSKEEEEIDYDQMVMLEEEEEWTYRRPEKALAGDVSPDPQEVVVIPKQPEESVFDGVASH